MEHEEIIRAGSTRGRVPIQGGSGTRPGAVEFVDGGGESHVRPGLAGRLEDVPEPVPV